MDDEVFRERWNNIEEFELLDKYTVSLLEWSDELCMRIRHRLAEADVPATRSAVMMDFFKEVEAKGRESPYMNRTVRATGDVSESYFDVTTGSNKERDAWLEDEALIWGGLHCGVVGDGDNIHPTVGYRLIRPQPTIIRDVGSLTNTLHHHTVTAPIGSIEVKGFDYGMIHYERFASDHPDVAEYLAYCFDNVETDECETVMRLASLRLPDTLLRDEVEVLESYLNHRVQLDRSVPYQARLEGPAYMEVRGLDQAIPLNLNEKTLMTGVRLELLLQQETAKTDRYFVPYLDAALLPPYRQGRPHWVKLPLTSISQLYSGRILPEDEQL